MGNIAKLYDSVRAGVVDIAHGLRGIPRGRFAKTGIIELPFMTGSADAASRAMWAVYPKYLKDEYPGVKVLALHAHNGGLIHTRDKPVVTMADLKGLRIRFPSAPIKAMLESLGAVPQGLPPGKVYENTQKGVIDGTVFPWDPMHSFKLSEVMNYHLDMGGILHGLLLVRDEREEVQQSAGRCAQGDRRYLRRQSGRQVRPLVGQVGQLGHREGPGQRRDGHQTVAGRGRPLEGNDHADRRQLARRIWNPTASPNAREIYDAMKAEIAKVEGN